VIDATTTAAQALNALRTAFVTKRFSCVSMNDK
jgi:hypothetical protein